MKNMKLNYVVGLLRKVVVENLDIPLAVAADNLDLLGNLGLLLGSLGNLQRKI